MCFICNVKYTVDERGEFNRKLVVTTNSFTKAIGKIEETYRDALISVDISLLSNGEYIYLPKDEAVIESIRKENEI